MGNHYTWQDIDEINKAQTLVDTIKELYKTKQYDYRNGNCNFIINNECYKIDQDYLKATYLLEKEGL